MTNVEQLFQISVLDEFVANQDMELIKQRWLKFQNFLSKRDYIESVKEEKYQDGFLKDIFEQSLGYTLDSTNPDDYNLVREKKNTIDAKKADGAIVIDTHIVGLIELKGQDTQNLDKRGLREQSAVDQVFGYLNSHDSSHAKYTIVSNFNELRFYITDKTNYESFFLLDMDFESFCRLHTILSYESIVAQIPLQIKEKSVTFEIDISNSFYKDYTKFRTELFENIIQNNKDLDPYTLLNATQKLIDRIVFIFFGEDTELLPLNTIPTIIKEHQAQRLTDYSLYDVYKIYFQAINSGNSRLDIERYNGGLFAPDEYLDSLVIGNKVLDSQAKILSAYRFGSDISVNILGHIFEQSISDLEEMTAQIANESFDKKQSKRKKDGVFYTPAYITKYIVANTLGTLCQSKREELEIADIALNKGTKSKTKEVLNSKLESYKEWLLNLKILDPACGSGAFLNQALEFLIEEHKSLQLDFLKLGNIFMTYNIEESILENNLYGVDINEGAVEIAKLSLWLRTATKGRSLTTLADKIKVANSLLDMPFGQGSFDIVIGNPPYVRQESIKEQKPALKERYSTFVGTADLFVYFYELGLDMLKMGGVKGYICSNKFFRAKYGQKLREMILTQTTIQSIVDFNSVKVFEDATVDSAITILQKGYIEDSNFAISLNSLDNFFDMSQSDLTKDSFSFVTPEELAIKKKIERVGTPLKEWDINIYRGILTGFNEAFIIDGTKKDELIGLDRRNAEIIKPLLRGRNLQKYLSASSEEFLIVTHNNPPINIDEYPIIKEYLDRYYERLAKRGDKGLTPYNLRNCAYLNSFENDKILYPEFSSSSLFSLDTNASYLLDTSWFIDKGDKCLLAFLNSKLIWYYLSFITSTMGSASLRLKKIFIEKLPIPKLPNIELYKKNIEYLLDMPRKEIYDRDTKYPIGIFEDREIYLTEFLFAKQLGNIEKFQGHKELRDYFRLLPFVFCNNLFDEVFQNIDNRREIYSFFYNDNDRIFHIIDEEDYLVSIFANTEKNFIKQIDKKFRLSKSTREGGYFSILSPAEPFWRQVDLIESLYQELTKKSISQNDFIKLVDTILQAKENIAKYNRHFESLNAIDKIEIKEEIARLQEVIDRSVLDIDDLLYEVYGLDRGEIGIVEGVK